MSFQSTNYSVSMLLLMAATVAMMIVRAKKPLENNWPVFYWILVLLISLRWPEDTWDFRVVLVGAAAGFLLRFEFMNAFFVRLVRLAEIGVQVYMLYTALLRIVY